MVDARFMEVAGAVMIAVATYDLWGAVALLICGVITLSICIQAES